VATTVRLGPMVALVVVVVTTLEGQARVVKDMREAQEQQDLNMVLAVAVAQEEWVPTEVHLLLMAVQVVLGKRIRSEGPISPWAAAVAAVPTWHVLTRLKEA